MYFIVNVRFVGVLKTWFIKNARIGKLHGNVFMFFVLWQQYFSFAGLNYVFCNILVFISFRYLQH